MNAIHFHISIQDWRKVLVTIIKLRFDLQITAILKNDFKNKFFIIMFIPKIKVSQVAKGVNFHSIMCTQELTIRETLTMYKLVSS